MEEFQGFFNRLYFIEFFAVKVFPDGMKSREFSEVERSRESRVTDRFLSYWVSTGWELLPGHATRSSKPITLPNSASHAAFPRLLNFDISRIL